MTKILTANDLHRMLSEVMTLPENISAMQLDAAAGKPVEVRITCLLKDVQANLLVTQLRSYHLEQSSPDVVFSQPITGRGSGGDDATP